MTHNTTFKDRLLSAAGNVFWKLITGQSGSDAGPPDQFWATVKLVHADELKAWNSFKAYQDHQSLTYAEYRGGREQLERWREEVRAPLAARQRLADLDVDTLEKYDTIKIPVAASLLRKRMEIPLPEPPHDLTTMTCYDGEIREGRLLVKATWRSRKAFVYRSCPSRILHAGEITTLRQQLANLPPNERETLQRIDESRFAHPVLFISHRWESLAHPDPSGQQLTKLQALRDCYVIYDYSSFPQDPASEDSLMLVLTHMNTLIQRVVVLESAQYLDRGWCIYEYILASMTTSLVCDEINDPVFVKLRNLRATEVPPVPGESVFRPSTQSEIQNRIDEDILKTVNQLLPRFRESLFTVEGDRSIVSNLLLTELLAILPARKEHVPYGGEWNTIPWTREDLQQAFQHELSWEPLQTSHRLKPYQLRVPNSVQSAVENGYVLDKAPPPNAATWLQHLLRGERSSD